MFGFWRRKKKQQAPEDPVDTFDRWIEALERQGAQLRRSAATLLAARGEQHREADAWGVRVREAEARWEEAARRNDRELTRALEVDLNEAKAQRAELEAELVRGQADAELLLEAAEEVRRQLTQLHNERRHARQRLESARAVEAAWRERGARFEQLLEMDAARDEVERAHALAELYRDALQKE